MGNYNPAIETVNAVISKWESPIVLNTWQKYTVWKQWPLLRLLVKPRISACITKENQHSWPNALAKKRQLINKANCSVHPSLPDRSYRTRSIEEWTTVICNLVWNYTDRPQYLAVVSWTIWLDEAILVLHHAEWASLETETIVLTCASNS